MSNKNNVPFTLISDCQEWLQKSTDPLIGGNRKLQREFARSKHKLQLLDRAMNKKMAVATYGASQAGKSYLVAAMASGANKQLTAVIGDKKYDFIKLINPEGGQESTGLVTRFTTDGSNIPDPEHPLKISLLDVIDVIKLFVNSFANDISPGEDASIDDDCDFINDSLSEIESRISGQHDGRAPSIQVIGVENFYDLEDYCNAKFQGIVFFQALKKANFWGRVETLLEVLPQESFFDAIKLLWRSLSRYNELFDLLRASLASLNYSREAYCAIDAIIAVDSTGEKRSKASIINAQTLYQFEQLSEEGISLSLQGGKEVVISRPIVCALAAEISFSIADPGHNFFKDSDLLDFPGARSRKTQSISSFSKEVGLPIENFLRGKVAYLFDKYVTEFEISGMLLCVGPSNQETVGLDSLIEEWVLKTHGQKPEDRSTLPCSLFLVLTKFDQEFNNARGVEIGPQRWETRLRASLEEPFGGKRSALTNWVNHWDKSGSFKNVFWLRNPNAEQSHIVDYVSEAGRSPEMRYREDKEHFITELRLSFVESEVAQKYFKQPAVSWDEALKLNDGGASYILSELTKIASKTTRASQLFEAMGKELEHRRLDLVQFLIPDGSEEALKKQLEFVHKFIKTCNIFLHKERLGEFISALYIDDDVMSVFDSARREHAKLVTSRRSQVGRQTQEDVPLDPALAQMMGLTSNASEQAGEKLEISLALKLVTDYLDNWADRVLKKLTEPGASDYLHTDREFVVAFIAEWKKLAFNSGLVEDLSILLDNAAQIRTGNPKYWVARQAAIFRSYFNSFIDLGGSRVNGPLDIEYPDGRKGRIFIPMEIANPELIISDVPTDYARIYFIDWITSAQYAFMKNVSNAVVSMQARKENDALQSLLSEFPIVLSAYQHMGVKG